MACPRGHAQQLKKGLLRPLASYDPHAEQCLPHLILASQSADKQVTRVWDRSVARRRALVKAFLRSVLANAGGASDVARNAPLRTQSQASASLMFIGD